MGNAGLGRTKTCLKKPTFARTLYARITSLVFSVAIHRNYPGFGGCEQQGYLMFSGRKGGWQEV